MDRKFLMTSLGYAILGLLLGIHMAASHNHSQLVTHAHIMLVGFVVSFAYALCHKLWLPLAQPTLAKVQFVLHQFGTLAIVVGLFVLYGKYMADAKIEPLLTAGSLAVLVAMILMKVMVIRSGKVAEHS